MSQFQGQNVSLANTPSPACFLSLYGPARESYAWRRHWRTEQRKAIQDRGTHRQLYNLTLELTRHHKLIEHLKSARRGRR
jgi:hypothetical protein